MCGRSSPCRRLTVPGPGESAACSGALAAAHGGGGDGRDAAGAADRGGFADRVQNLPAGRDGPGRHRAPRTAVENMPQVAGVSVHGGE